MPTVVLLAATASYATQIMLLGLGIVLGMLLLGVCQLSFLGYLKGRELWRLWRLPQAGAVSEDSPLTAPEPPAESRSSMPHKPHLRAVASLAPAASRNGQALNARAALRRNAGCHDESRSA